ncbi:restriction endonuclease subunit S [Actinomadura sp. SCN-SB]|uniref:restriction endonuclease subunit S n=1 Tax=Actinomadura sp. SCN-SB TaxID=3373092 RepID=UPI003752D74F
MRYGLAQPPQSSTSGVPILRATNIYRGSIRSEGLIYSALEDIPLDRAPLLEAGEILVVRSGAYTGDSALVTPEWEGAAPGYDLRITPEHVEPRYLAFALLSAPVLHQIEVASSRAAQSHLNAEELGEVRVCLPPLEEQRRIADFLEGETVRLKKLRAMALRLRDLLQARRKAVIFALVTGADWSSKVSSGLPWVESIPAHWRSAKINYFARMGSGHTPSRNRPEWWINPEFCWITTGEVAQVRDDRAEVITETRERISKAGLENSSAELHPAGTVVLCRTASAGYSAVMGSQMATSQDFVTWTCGEELDPFYLLWCLRAMRDDLLGRLATGSTHKTIYVPDLQMLKIPVPPISEQQKIVARIRASNAEIDALLDLVDKQLKLLEERRRALITAAVTGQLDVTTARGA